MDLWPAVSLSLRIALAATAVVLVVAVPLAYAMTRRRFPGRSLLDALILLPLVLPPTVVGYVLLAALGRKGPLEWLLGGYSIAFRFEGAVLAAACVAFPMLYLPARAGFLSVPRELEDHARLFGANRLQLFWHVSLPLARRPLAAGLVLAFARALGEFGATAMVYGWQEDRVTLPISVYAAYTEGEASHALPAVLALTGCSVALIVLYNATATTRAE